MLVAVKELRKNSQLYGDDHKQLKPLLTLTAKNRTEMTASIKIIKRMNGYRRSASTSNIVCGHYTCKLALGQLHTSGADIAMFDEHSLDQFFTPPKKGSHERWAFVSKEAQNHIYKAPLAAWDGFFNYSVTYVRETEATYYSFRNHIIPRKIAVAQDFAAKYANRTLRALWFVSHCKDRWKLHKVWSARVEYVQELSKYIPIDIYTHHHTCRRQLGSLIKNTTQPMLTQYMFYLSFESTLCRDYISEKFWKVLEAFGPTIPVALGGLSIEEYEYVAPPNSFIHVKNFSSPKALASHLKFVAEDADAFRYYHQWRNKYYLPEKKKIEGAGGKKCFMW